MKQQIAASLLRSMVAACLLTAGAQAQAATNWNASYATCANGSTVATPGAFGTCGGSGVEVRATSIIGGAITDATVKAWGGNGLGVKNQNESDASGPHALDNYAGLDALIFKFTEAVSLTSLTLGWNGTDNPTTTGGVNYNDSDVSIYAWTGAAATPTSYASTVAGWTLIGDYFNVGVGSNTEAVSTSVFSSYWLVSAYGTGLTYKTDAFKVLSLAGNYCDKTVVGARCTTPPGGDVPEPGSLALMAMGAMGLMAARRRRKHQAV